MTPFQHEERRWSRSMTTYIKGLQAQRAREARLDIAQNGPRPTGPQAEALDKAAADFAQNIRSHWGSLYGSAPFERPPRKQAPPGPAPDQSQEI
ncbi:MAG: hypothetical protein PW734_01090 [Verrucomicrobium sp.]|nr:hypothetical protein [Verrucomicrobium sp.]